MKFNAMKLQYNLKTAYVKQLKFFGFLANNSETKNFGMHL